MQGALLSYPGAQRWLHQCLTIGIVAAANSFAGARIIAKIVCCDGSNLDN